MRTTALCIVELDENGKCLLQQPIHVIEEGDPDVLSANFNNLISGFEVRNHAYMGVLNLRFLLERLYRDTANPENPTAGYTNALFFVILSNWDATIQKIKGSIKKRHQERLANETNYVRKAIIMKDNATESATMSGILSAMDLLKGFIQSKISENFSPEEYERTIQVLAANKPSYADTLLAINDSMREVFLNQDAGFEKPEAVYAFFMKINEGIEYLRTL